MPRIPALPASDLPEEFRAALRRVHDAYGFVPNSMLTMGRNPALLSAFSALGAAVMGDASSLPSDLRWLVAHLASRSAGCRYCIAHTGHNSAGVAGVDEAKVAAAWQFETCDRFDDAERAALRLAVAGAGVPNGATDDHFAELRRHFSDRQIVDLVAVIAFFGFLNRWNDTLATELEATPSAFGAEHLAASGWDPGKHAPAVGPD